MIIDNEQFTKLREKLKQISSKEQDDILSKSSFFASILAFYLPQFHPIPENDAWWGKGFTEWRNVVKARPRFMNHYQPRLPADLGFYDLRVPEIKEEQAELAKIHGIHGFVYYHYWFNGKRLLNRPIDDIVSSGKPIFPFCLCWANETWSNSWGPTYGSNSKDGANRTVLIEQRYSQQDDYNHIRWLSKILEDERYIKINGKPLLLVFRPGLIPNPKQTTDLWRNEVRKTGFKDLYLCAAQPFAEDRKDPNEFGFDAAVEIQPDPRRREALTLSNGEASSEKLFDYQTAVDISLKQERLQYTRHNCIIPNWDNTARREKGATIYVDSTPEKYGNWMLNLLLKLESNNSSENLLFVNSWNEWAEGSQLEPDEKWGKKYLEAHKDALLIYILLQMNNLTLSLE